MKDSIGESSRDNVRPVSTVELSRWIEHLNGMNLVVLVVGNSFFNGATGWHDIRVYRFARAFEALGFTPLVMCRWTTAVTEVAGTYDGIAFCRVGKTPKSPLTLTPSMVATVAPVTGMDATDTPNDGLSNNSDVHASRCSSPDSVFGAEASPRIKQASPGFATAGRLLARDVADRFGVRKSARSAWRCACRLARGVIRLARGVIRLARGVIRLARGVIRLRYRIYRVARIVRSRTVRASVWTVRVARNRSSRTVRWFVAPWVRYHNLQFSRDFGQVAQSLRPCFIYAADLNTLLAASRLARSRSVPLIYDSHEYFLSHSAHSWMSPARRFIDRFTCRILEAHLVPHAYRVISVSDGLVQKFSQRFPNVTCICVRNLPLTAVMKPRNDRIRTEIDISSGTRIAIYIGFITGGRGISELLQAASHLPDDIVIVFLGGGRHLSLRRQEAVDRGVDNRVYFLGHVPQEEVQSYAAAADCGLSLIQPTCLSYYHSLPNKMFQYAVSGTPMVCSDFPDMASLVKRYDMGDVCDPTNPQEISRTIVRMLSDPKRWKAMSGNCLRAARNELNWETEANKLSFCSEFASSHK